MSLEQKKKEVQMQKHLAAKAELELKLMEKMADIDRIKNHLAIKEREIEELKEHLNA